MACEECNARIKRMADHVDEINALRRKDRKDISDLENRIVVLQERLDALMVWEQTPGAPEYEELVARFTFRYGREDLARFLAARVAKQVRKVLKFAEKEQMDVQIVAADAADCEDKKAYQVFYERMQSWHSVMAYFDFHQSGSKRRFVVGCAAAERPYFD